MSSLAPQRPDGFFDDWEIASAQTRIDLIRSRLDSHIAYCRTAVPFFHERLDGFDPTAGAALQNVPQMGANDLRTHLPPAGDALLGPDRLAITMFQSGGTTGMPKSAPFSHQELEALTFANARGFHAVGLKTEDRVANMFAVGSLYMTFVHINRMLQEFGCTNFPFASNTPPDFVDTVVDVFNINCFTGIASIVLDCLRAIGDKRELRVEKVFYGGEHIYDADVEELMTRFGVRTVAAPGYGTVESWYIGYQCAECPRGVFHAHDDQTYIEIVDEEGKPCEPGEVGDILVTPFARRLAPTVRFRVGDRARWLDDPCSCGRTTPRFELLGRGDDTLRIGYDSVDYGFVQELVADLQKRYGTSALSGAVQIQKHRREGRDLLRVCIESNASSDSRTEIIDAVHARLLSQRPSLRQFVEKETIWSPEIELSAPGSLERNPRTGKLRRVIDSIPED